MPCHLSNIFFLPINIKINNNILANAAIKISWLLLVLKGIGWIIALKPKIKNILKILEPTIPPTAISVFFL